MKELLLFVHIIIAASSIALAAMGLVGKQRLSHLANRGFAPSIIGLVGTGVGLVFTGASITHACVSGTLTVTALVVLRQASAKRSIKEPIPAQTRTYK